jgi:lipoate-protein ligase A
VIESPTHDPALNIEREAHYMMAVEAPSYRVWRSTDSVVLGRFLEPASEVDVSLAVRLGVPVLKRPSGGGAVFHDLGNVNYSIYLPRNLSPVGRVEDGLRALSFPVIDVLEQYGVPWSWEPPNNICINGLKISGSAQARSGEHLVHHGTLLVSTNLKRLGSLLKRNGRSKWVPVVNLSEVSEGATVDEITAVMERVLQNNILYCEGDRILSILSKPESDEASLPGEEAMNGTGKR